MRNLGIWLAFGVSALASSVGQAQEAKLPPPSPASAPPAAAVVVPGEPHTWSVSCCDRTGCGSKCQKIWDWLTYRPLSSPGICACCCKRPACCTPPLYAYFLPQNCGKGRCIHGSCIAGTCPSSACCKDDCADGACGSHCHILGSLHHKKECETTTSCWFDWRHVGERFGKCWTPSSCDQAVIVSNEPQK